MTSPPSSSLCAFVAGATGFAGRYVVQALRARHIRTIAHVRPDAPRRAHWEKTFSAWGAEVVAAAWEPQAIESAMAAASPTHVFTLLGTTRARAKREGLALPYATVDIGLSKLVIDAARTLPHLPLTTYLSSAGTDKPRGAYLAARHEVECYLKASGLPYVIARPGLFSGDRDEPREGERFAAAVLPPIAACLRWVGAKQLAAQATPMTGLQLGESMVRHVLGATRQGTVLEAVDLQAPVP